MRLIDADALTAKFVEVGKYLKSSAYRLAFIAAINEMENSPTVDAVPIDWLIEQEENVLNGDDFRDECAGVRLAWMAEAERKEE